MSQDGGLGGLHVTALDGVVVIAIVGTLDEVTGDDLVRAAGAAVADGAARLDIDLQRLDGFTDDGAACLVTCRDLGVGLADGVHYRTGQGAGRDALLSAYAR